MRRFSRWGLLLGFALLIGLLWHGLGQNPTEVPSPLIGQQLPAFRLTLVGNGKPVSDETLRGNLAILNVWASWCMACRYEHPLWMQLAKQQRIYSLNYKDQRQAAQQWLAKHGNPYRLSVFDPKGSFAIDLGVYGTPETFLLDAHGVIRGKWVGMMTAGRWHSEVEPMIAAIKAEKKQ